MASADYIKTIIAKFLKLENKGIKLNIELQELYNSKKYEEVLILLQEYNLSLRVPYLASGLSCYFNKQINENGLINLKISKEDIEDAKFIAACFGKTINYSDNNLPILYTTLPGTTEFNYGMQTFPAGIFEDVFQCSANHSLPIQPIVGENEVDYYCRVLDYQIKNSKNFPMEKRNEVLMRGKRLTVNFCKGKNRIYLIPFNNVMDNKASFGDIDGLRDGNLTGVELQQKLDTLPSFKQLLQEYSIEITNPYINPNMTSEYGIAIYGPIISKDITYFEIDRIYDLIQKKAKEMGFTNREIIPNEVGLNIEEDRNSLSRM